ncbi:MAG TPA: hypothetical protein VFL55_11900 [Acetobacteraceae bacterium]|nr:hypothetical protein [Acetobacteraceae bacterium]
MAQDALYRVEVGMPARGPVQVIDGEQAEPRALKQADQKQPDQR